MPHSQRPMRALLIALAVGLAAVVVSSALAAGKPSVAFTTPKAGAKTGATVTFRVKLRNFGLDPRDVGKRNKPNRGHLHFQMDGGKYDYPKYSGANGKLAVKLGIAGKYSPSVTSSITYKHLRSGKHRLVVFLANNDHSAEGSKASLNFTVR